MNKVSEIRTAFLEYFAKNDHKIIKSAPLVPENDPTLLFVNAGMVPFKNYFTGELKAKYPRLVTSQKCVRAGGKHNDLDNVGYTTRHHTFFEMLGNFAFADYFKEEAISYAWNFVTSELGLSKDKLLVTVFHEDAEAFTLWKKIAGLKEDKIIKIATNDNFWAMGNVGPCGPCSEIFYDHGDKIKGNKPGDGDEGDRFIEIWNLVFMQYQLFENGQREKLPKPCIDTGMGLERVASIMQGKNNNFDIDLFQDLINSSVNLIGINNNNDISSHKVIADHLRSICFLIADGVIPSNEGRGYVLRRIIRRAIRHAHMIGSKEQILTKLAPNLIERMGDHFDELNAANDLIIQEISSEESKFSETLEKGLKILNESLAKSSSKILAGDVAFKLYDTYGFPLDLTQDILREKSMKVDEKVFNQLMLEQKRRAKEHWKGSGDVQDEKVFNKIANDIDGTNFLGYENINCNAKILSIIENGQTVNKSSNEDIVIITDKTVFYAESGGQIGDIGVAKGKNFELAILDCQKKIGGLFIHKAKLKSGQIQLNDKIELQIDDSYRKQIRANHTATHLLHKALKVVLGNHVVQKGSLVSDEILRFDFSHNKSLTKDEILQIEEIINNIIRQNVPVKTEVMDIEDAKAKGAMALFGEKYDDRVRVLSIKALMPKNENDYHAEFLDEIESIELCGGTHVNFTGDIALFKIISEGSIASGIRRIEAVTNIKAYDILSKSFDDINKISLKYQINKTEIDEKIASLINEKKLITKQISKYKIAEFREEALNNFQEINGEKVFLFKTKDLEVNDCRELVGQILKKEKSIVILFNVTSSDKINVILAKDADIKKINAGELIRDITPLIGGKGGGGKENFAQGGGLSSNDLNVVFEQVRKIILKKLT